MRRPLCVKCQTQFQVVKVGVTVAAMFSDPPVPYNLTKADLLECPGCGAQIVVGYGKHPYARRIHSDFQDQLNQVDYLVRDYGSPQPSGKETKCLQDTQRI